MDPDVFRKKSKFLTNALLTLTVRASPGMSKLWVISLPVSTPLVSPVSFTSSLILLLLSQIFVLIEYDFDLDLLRLLATEELSVLLLPEFTEFPTVNSLPLFTVDP